MSYRERLKSEALTVAQMGHQNIVQIYDVIEVDGNLCIIMELLQGKSLKAYIQEKGALPIMQAVRFATQACDALAHAHNHQPPIIHRDIKSENMMVADDQSIKIMDFGIAHMKEPEQENEDGQKVFGSAEYISPEQVRFARTEQ